MTALMGASINGHAEVVKWLLTVRGVDVNIINKVLYDMIQKLLHCCCYLKHSFRWNCFVTLGFFVSPDDYCSER